MREILRETFLKEEGYGEFDCKLIAGDASFRKYFRLMKGDETFILMDAPPDKEKKNKEFVEVSEFLTENGFSAPKILAQDMGDGFMILEDLGDDTYTRLIKAGEDERMLYRLAIDTLVDLRKDVEDYPDDLPEYDEDLLMQEVEIFLDYWVPQAMGEGFLDEDKREAFIKAWEEPFEYLKLDYLDTKDPMIVLRDYHVDNLLYLPERKLQARCGLLDFQDAVLGNAIYDVSSLLEDARRDISVQLKEEMKMRYNSAFLELDTEEFDTLFAIFGAQRHLKVIGIFVRLCVRDGKPIYLEHIPRVWNLLEGALRHPIMKDVRKWMDENIEEDKRGIPSCLIETSNRE